MSPWKVLDRKNPNTGPEYDASKYMTDPRFPDLQCPICDYESETIEQFGKHLARHNDKEIIQALYIINALNWRMEQLIRRLTGKQAFEAIEAEGDL